MDAPQISTIAPRILVSPPGSLENCVLSFPLLAALRDLYPQALLVWAVEDHLTAFARQHACLDELLELPRDWPRDLRRHLRLRRRLAGRFDVAMDPAGTNASAWFARLSGAAVRIGHAQRRCGGLSAWLNNVFVSESSSTDVDGTHPLVAPLGVASPADLFPLAVPPEVESRIESWASNAHLGCGFVLFHPGRTQRCGRRAARDLGKIARQLGERFRLTSVIAELPGDGPSGACVARVIHGSGGHAISAPRVSLLEMAALSRRARLLVSVDPGCALLCGALGRPSVALCAPSRTVPDHLFDGQLVWLSEAARRGDCGASPDIDVDFVSDRCTLLLEGHGGAETRAA